MKYLFTAPQKQHTAVDGVDRERWRPETSHVDELVDTDPKVLVFYTSSHLVNYENFQTSSIY